ncbi:hydrolase [Sphaerisporangium rufum]|uniref:Hydrolase n=1 Tax=Sphaerisporangium rufum TaxID=1381558 RepID=A0A919V177_9ACTN|nr:VOC family protein [Sphaerisporangium rufum]GII78297.1 hydrolase [Sphaerisporangium rufum]
MAERAHYPDGAPCWPELTTNDLAGATRFYQRVFDWSCEDLGRHLWHYTLCRIGEAPVAALTPPAVGMEGVAPAWTTYLATSDIEASVVRVEANGGKLVVLPTALPGYARFALAADPDGAPFGLWQAAGHAGAALVGEPGAMCWAEVHSRNPMAADGFYEALFGYEREQQGDGVDFDYVLMKIRGTAVCGRLRMPYEAAGEVPHWLVHFTVADCEETTARVVRAGGEVLISPFEMRETLVAYAADPSGARFAVCQGGG